MNYRSDLLEGPRKKNLTHAKLEDWIEIELIHQPQKNTMKDAADMESIEISRAKLNWANIVEDIDERWC